MDSFNKVEVLDKANYFALKDGKQIMFFTTRKQGDYLILWCKAEGTKSKYKLSPEGENYSKNNPFNDQSSLIGKITYLPIKKNNPDLWKELFDKKLFSLWDPKEGPYLYNKTNLKRIAFCQVFEMNINIEKADIGCGRTSRILKNVEKIKIIESSLSKMKSAIDESAFEKTKSMIIDIINKYQ